MDFNREQRRELERSDKTSNQAELKWSDVKNVDLANVEIVETDDSHPNLVAGTLLEVTGFARKVTPRKSKKIKVIGRSLKKEGYYKVRIDSGCGVEVEVPADTLTQVYTIIKK